MRKLLFLLFPVLLYAMPAKTQNMVPNGNFEYFDSCPTTLSETYLASPWRSYHLGSTDYFNTCAIHPNNAAVPQTFFGYQAPASGNGFVGGYAIMTFITSDYSELLATPITPLSIGSKYEVSLSINRSNNSGAASNGIGVYLYDNGPTNTIRTSFISHLSITPQINFTRYCAITDTQNWIRVVDTFTADSAYDNMVIGNFPMVTNYAVVGGGFVYYYYDSVVVKLASGINNLYMDSMICAGDTFQVPYTLNNSYATYLSSNTLSVQLSNSAGSFSSGTTIIGTKTGNSNGSIACVVPTSITPGNDYRLRIISSNAADTSGNSVKAIKIGVVRPVKPIGGSNSPICTGDTLRLTASTSTTGVQYKWGGPATFVNNTQNPMIPAATPARSGNYIVTAHLYGCIAKDTTNVYVSVGNPALVNASTPNTVICSNDSLVLNATVPIAANSYTWSGPYSFSSATKDTFITSSNPDNSGSYIFTAYYTGCTVRDTVNVLVKPLPNNRYKSASDTVLCSGKSLTLSAGSTTSGTNYTWTGPNSFNVNTQNTVINNTTTAMTGYYTIRYEYNGCSIKDSINVTINPSPIAITASANTPLCQGDTLRLNSTNSSTGVTWQWTGPGSYNATAKDTLLSNAQISASGDYIVTATNSHNCKAKDTVNVLVKPLPANLSATVNTPVCAGTTLLLSATTTSSGTVFSWVGPNSYNSSIQNPNIPAAATNATGNYIVTATLNGCSVKDTVSAIVNALPATPAATANTPVCIGQDLMLNASTIPGATYQWTNAASFSSLLQNPVITNAKTTDAGKYYVRSVMNNCYSPFDSVTVNVIPAPSISVYPSPKDSICQGATVNFVSSNTNAGSTFIRTWYKNNNIIGSAANANYSTASAADNDEYFVTLTVSGICATPYTDTSNKITMKVLPWLAPSVSITANPNTTVISGTMINFTATPVNGGIKPTYQWTRNGANITGAISNIWGASTLSNNDQICVDMTSSYMCPNPKNTKSNCIKVSIESTGIARTWTEKVPRIYPNPVNDLIIIDGLEKETRIQLNDVIGRNVYNQLCKTTITQINTSNLVPGSYVLLLKTADGNSMAVKIIKQ